MKIKIIKAVKNESRGRVFIEVEVDGKKKRWNVAKGLYEILIELIGIPEKLN